MSFCQVGGCPQPFTATTVMYASGIAHVCDPCRAVIEALTEQYRVVTA